MKDTAFKAQLITKGRKSGREHAVWLRAVSYQGMIYFSRRNENSDWLKNAIVDSTVKVIIDGAVHIGTASLVEDDSLVKEISRIKYPGEKRADDPRVALQIILKE